tara:strand:+ start:31 stop:588 length:558 start_codon:yes stop_codon:yes gene_type:complete
VFEERRGTVEASLHYLETLASNYARLSPEPRRRRCDLNEIVRALVSAAPPDGAVRLESRLASSMPTIMGDPVSLRRIVENLVANAIDSLDGPGEVLVTTELIEPDRSRVSLSVVDTGRGMTDEETERVFNDFYTTKPDGTGLGLSIVRRLVLDLRGTVRVTSEIGKGTRVVVEIPIVDGTRESAP